MTCDIKIHCVKRYFKIRSIGQFGYNQKNAFKKIMHTNKRLNKKKSVFIKMME